MNKKFSFGGYNLLDLLLLCSGLATITIVSILFSSPWYVVISTLLGILCVFTQAKGKVATQFIGIIYFCFYIAISYSQKLYGESILYFVIMLPMYIYGSINWIRNRNVKENVVKVKNNLSKKEWTISVFCFVILSIIIYFVLKLLKTDELVLSTLSFVSMLPAIYLLARRCKWNQVAFLINDFIVPILWLMQILKGDEILMPLCVYHLFQIIYDIYGLVNWIKLEKSQNNSKTPQN